MHGDRPQSGSEFEPPAGIFSVPAPVRFANALLSRIAPPLAVRLASRLFSIPRRAQVRAYEEEVLERADRFSHDFEGQRLRGYAWGDGPVVFFLHGWGSRGSRFALFVDPLVRAGFRVITWDAPAHGDSQGRTTNAPTIARAFRSVADSTGPLHAIVAHSLGSWVAALSLQNGVDADRVAFIAPPGDLHFFSRNFIAALGFSAPIHAGMEALFERRTGIPWQRLTVQGLSEGQTAPLIVIHDRHDATVPLDQARLLTEGWPGASLLETSGLGHRAIMKDPEVIEAVVRFLT